MMAAEVLRSEGYEVHESWSPATARRLLRSVRPRLVIIDLAASEHITTSLVNELPHATGAIVIAADKSSDARIRCLEAGAIDYMIRPIDHHELALKVGNLVSFSGVAVEPASAFDLGPLRIDLVTRVLTSTSEGTECSLTNSEFALLVIFLKSRGSILSRRMLIDLMNYSEESILGRSLDVLISKLRGKLKDLGQAGLIWSVRGEGYRLRVEDLSIPPQLFSDRLPKTTSRETCD